MKRTQNEQSESLVRDIPFGRDNQRHCRTCNTSQRKRLLHIGVLAASATVLIVGQFFVVPSVGSPPAPPTVEQRLERVEAILLTAPERAISVPLLARDVKAVGDRSDQQILLVRAELIALASSIQRVETYFLWILGLLAGIATTIVAIAARFLWQASLTHQTHPSAGRSSANDSRDTCGK
jgi:hypothetical protein